RACRRGRLSLHSDLSQLVHRTLATLDRPRIRRHRRVSAPRAGPSVATEARMNASRPLLELKHVSKRFGALRVLDDVSFGIHTGETVGLIGPNGAGKTSLFNVISGLLAPCDGQVWLDGRNLGRKRSETRARL